MPPADRPLRRAGGGALAVEAAAWLTLAHLAVRCVPFRWLAPRLGAANRVSPADVGPRAADVSARVARAVRAAERRLPWRSPCLASALAAKAMLRRRGLASTLYLGVDPRDAGRVSAHAWLRCGGAVLTGEAERWRYAVVATFAEPNG